MADRRLPQGFWVYFNNLPDGTTNESLSAFLYSIGIDIPEQAIDVKLNRNRSVAATVVYSQELAVTLLKWALNGQTFNGRTLTPTYIPRRDGGW